MTDVDMTDPATPDKHRSDRYYKWPTDDRPQPIHDRTLCDRCHLSVTNHQGSARVLTE